jgi:hypothetical protein
MSRPSPYGDVLALADQALASETGLEVECTMPRHATNLRMRFYAKRDEMRDLGNPKYDDLVVTIERNKVVVFRKKSAAPAVQEVRTI